MGEDEPTKRPSRKERKKIERQKREEESRTKVCPQKPLWRRGGKFLLLFGLQGLGVTGGIAAVLSFSPAFSVSSEPSLDPSNVMTSLFLIQYESPIPVAEVNPICLVNKLESPDPFWPHRREWRGSLVDYRQDCGKETQSLSHARFQLKVNSEMPISRFECNLSRFSCRDSCSGSRGKEISGLSQSSNPMDNCDLCQNRKISKRTSLLSCLGIQTDPLPKKG
jgi:hypothetical protein